MNACSTDCHHSSAVTRQSHIITRPAVTRPHSPESSSHSHPHHSQPPPASLPHSDRDHHANVSPISCGSIAVAAFVRCRSCSNEALSPQSRKAAPPTANAILCTHTTPITTRHEDSWSRRRRRHENDARPHAARPIPAPPDEHRRHPTTATASPPPPHHCNSIAAPHQATPHPPGYSPPANPPPQIAPPPAPPPAMASSPQWVVTQDKTFRKWCVPWAHPLPAVPLGSLPPRQAQLEARRAPAQARRLAQEGPQ